MVFPETDIYSLTVLFKSLHLSNIPPALAKHASAHKVSMPSELLQTLFCLNF